MTQKCHNKQRRLASAQETMSVLRNEDKREQRNVPCPYLCVNDKQAFLSYHHVDK